MRVVSRAANLKQARGLLDRDGICMLKNMLDAAGLERVRRALHQGIARDERAGFQVRGRLLTRGPEPVLSHEEQELIGLETARILQRAGALPVLPDLSDDREQKS